MAEQPLAEPRPLQQSAFHFIHFISFHFHEGTQGASAVSLGNQFHFFKKKNQITPIRLSYPHQTLHLATGTGHRGYTLISAGDDRSYDQKIYIILE